MTKNRAIGKKKGGKRDGTSSDNPPFHLPEEDPSLLLAQYSAHCAAIGLKINTDTDPVVKSLSSHDNPHLGKQIIIDGNSDEHYSTTFSSGHCRALAWACLGKSLPQQDTIPITKNKNEQMVYKALKELRIWRVEIGDYGVEAISDILRLGSDKISLSFLELLDCKVGQSGARAIGKGLNGGMNRTLRTLILDNNLSLSCEGLVNLCAGLKTNSDLVNLSLKRCNISHLGASAIGEVLKFSRSNLQSIDLTGNKIGGQGLLYLGEGLKHNKRLVSLHIADNLIKSTNIDSAGLRAFRLAVSHQSSCLNLIDLRYNQIGESAKELLPELGLENRKLTTLLVDVSLPRDLFMMLNRSSTGGKSKKKKKEKKKRK